MTARWNTVPIRELYDGLYDGPHATPKPANDGPIFLGIKNVTDDGKLDLSEIRHIAEEDYATWTRRIEPRPGDLVFTYEATLNRYAIIPEGFRGCLGRRMALIRPDPSKADVRFLLYSFFTDAWRAVIKQNTLTGATVDRIPLTKFPEFPIAAPDVAVQRRIADELAAYDQLIENCQRRVQILESMARALYREWFVEFRFPGHGYLPQATSAESAPPPNWRTAVIGEVVSLLTRGISPAYDEQGSSLVLNQKCIRDERVSLGPARRQRKMVPDEKLVRLHDVLINSTGVGTLGRVAQICTTLDHCTVDSHVTIARPSASVNPEYFGYALLARQDVFERLGAGATGQTELSRTAVHQVELLLPPRDLQDRFGSLVRPMRVAATTLSKQVAHLRATRDLLLPRLLSGQLDLASAEASLS